MPTSDDDRARVRPGPVAVPAVLEEWVEGAVTPSAVPVPLEPGLSIAWPPRGDDCGCSPGITSSAARWHHGSCAKCAMTVSA
jgi:hypothetical protein